MNLIAKTLGAAVVSILLVALMLVIVGTTLWLIIPIALPVSITWTNGLGLAGLLYVVKAVCKS